MIKISVQISSLHGERERCEIEIKQGVPLEMTVRSQHFGSLSFVTDNLFSALLEFRRRIEWEGYMLLCNVARKDAYPSRMALQMGGGRKVYLLKHGKQAKQEDLVDAFEEASIEQVCTVAEQQAAYEAWFMSLK
ncbi:MAG: hypothetical protein M0P19_14995 [Nevskia sp.]|nr:hypothetical protein [Nevskia sp.]MCK9384213.1 hypothetical protein [Nevskia sp.]